MKDTLRRKSNKSVDLDNADQATTPTKNGHTAESIIRHVRSVSNASVMAGGAGEKNPWGGEASISSRGPPEDNSDGRGRPENLDVPGSQRSERSVSEKPTRRRKKTLNQVTPHRFELVDARRDSVRPPVPTDTRSSTPSDEIVIHKTRRSRQASEAPLPELDFSDIRSVAEIVDVKPKQQRHAFSRIKVTANITPIEPAQPPPSPPVSPVSTATTPKRRAKPSLDFIGDFGLGRDIPNNPFVQSLTSVSSQHTANGLQNGHTKPYIYRPPPQPLPPGSLTNKVVIITNGTSLISLPLIQTFHAAGARVIFSTPHHLSDKARRFIQDLGPPHTIHFNACDLGSYADVHSLFNLALKMYGRIDHAIYAPGDDGGQVRGIGAGERFWGLEVGLAEGRHLTAKAELELIEQGEIKDSDSAITSDNIVGGPLNFARIAIAYLRNSPGRRQKHSTGEALTPRSGGFTDSAWSEDRSLTFITSTAAFTPIPYLPVYSTTQHAILGLVRSLGQSVDLRRDGIRVNLVATNMLLPSVVEASGGGRMSVQLPEERADNIGNIVAGIVANAGSNAAAARGGGWDGEATLHGRVLYAMGEEAVDVQDGLDRSEGYWLGGRAKEALDKASGKSDGGVRVKGRWMLMDSPDSPF